MRLLIDLGNSRAKWALSSPGEWRTGVAEHRGHDVPPLLEEKFGGMPSPTVVVIASVASADTRAAFEQWLQSRWRVPVHQVQAQSEQLGVVNRYRDPRTLGADRWAALLGAHGELPATAVCVVDCGTAVTVDALTARAEFAGGVILPGLALWRGALAAGTAGVQPPPGDETSCLARTTADAVAAGAVYGLAGAIERVCNEFETALGESMKLVITGGDADRLAAHLTRPVRRIPDLVLKGLDRIAATL
jgi:type III pantothenate kinase